MLWQHNIRGIRYKKGNNTRSSPVMCTQKLYFNSCYQRGVIFDFASASEFIHKLNKLHRDINRITALAQEPSTGAVVNMPRLRASMDLCLEGLPTLLKIEGDEAMPVTQLLPRVLSQLRALSVYSESGSTVGSDERLSESMGYVLQKVQ